MTLSIPNVHPIYEAATSAISYVIFDMPNGYAAIIDSVLDYQANTGKISTKPADLILEFIAQQKLTVQWILETHPHADHLSAASYLQKRVGGKIAISENICHVQQTFK